MNSSTVWLLYLFGAALLYQGGCRPNEQLGNPDDYPQDGEELYPDADGPEEDTNEGPEPEINTHNQQFDITPSGTIVLPCEVSGNTDYVTRIWRKEGAGLYLGSVRQTNDPRITLLNNGSLQISPVRAEDKGTYTCKLSTAAGREVIHELRVKTPAVITKITPSDKVAYVKKGASLTLECHSQGHPNPSTQWFLDGHLLQSQGLSSINGARYTIENASGNDTGTYKCTATNDQHIPAEQSVKIIVSSPPEVSLVKDIVGTGEGYESELRCTVMGIKGPELKWYKDNEPKPLKTSERIKFEQNGNEHVLRILKTQKSDFGSYKCEAKNVEGVASADITLTGTPTKPIAGTVLTEGESKSPVVTFHVESFSPIVEYELLYKRQEVNEWVSVKPTVSPASSSDDKLYVMKHVLTGLEPGVYDAQLKAKNSYGWSELSSIQTFPQAVSSTASNELRISLALFASLLVARYYC